MSTIRHHHPIHVNLWWYAAAAVLAGAVLALILATLQSSNPGVVTRTTDNHVVNEKGRFGANPYACSAKHPVPNIELPSCHSPVH
jgi:hypothetical protein